MIDSWPDTGRLGQSWPVLAGLSATPAGSGLRFAGDGIGWHLKRRPPEAIRAEVRITDALHAAGLPVTVFEPTVGGLRWLTWSGQAFALYRELPGETLPPNMAGVAGSKRLGAACARLHVALAEIDLTGLELPSATAWHRPRPAHLAAIFDRVGDSTGLPTQVLHRDFHLGNVLFDGELVSGYLDFDHLAVGPRPLDLAYAAGSALAREIEFGAGQPDLSRWVGRFAALVAGYHQVSPLTTAERDRLAPLAIEVQGGFLSWFASIDDPVNVALTTRMIVMLDGAQGLIRDALAEQR